MRLHLSLFGNILWQNLDISVEIGTMENSVLGQNIFPCRFCIELIFFFMQIHHIYRQNAGWFECDLCVSGV